MAKQTLLLLPGLMCDRTVWLDQVAGLDDLADCVVVDYGAADSLPAMAERALAAAAGPVAVAGHSMGGRAALELVRQAPGRVARLALMDTGYQARAAGQPGEAEIASRMGLVDLARREGMRVMGRQWLQGMVHPDRLADQALVDAILDMIERKTPDLFAAQQHALINRPDATALLGRLGCPTLVLCGNEDSWSPPARHRDMAAAIPGSTLVLVPVCGHMATMERPEAVTAAMRRWLAAA